jgi:hypothetical protein
LTKLLLFSIVLLLAIGIATSPVGLSYAQMPEQAQQKMEEKVHQNMPEHTSEVPASLDNFGVEVADFVKEAMMQFQDQREETISQIKQCREDMMDADPSERSQVRQDCRASLDEIKDSYRDIRVIFQETFNEYRDSIEVLRADAKGQQVSDSDKQSAMNDIRDNAKSRHLEMQEQNQSGIDVEQSREKMMSVHKGQ